MTIEQLKADLEVKVVHVKQAMDLIRKAMLELSAAQHTLSLDDSVKKPEKKKDKEVFF